jgi:putative ATP-binding cassette transporter
MLFLPQRPYMPLGTLREQLLYPKSSSDVSDEELQRLLAAVNLTDLSKRVGGFETVLNWTDVLSLGEQQRLAFARLLLAKPRYAILDEATSALDQANEANLYRQLRELGTTYISVGHRTSLTQYHTNILEIHGDSQWQLRPALSMPIAV